MSLVLKTLLTREWGLRFPLIGAPMANVARGRMAHAVTAAGGLGMIGVGNQDTPEFIRTEAAIARGGEGAPSRFGIGLTGWVLDARPELLDAALDEEPFLLSISFGSIRRHAAKAKKSRGLLAVQVNSRASAIEAVEAGADLIVAQGTEAGGHTGYAATMPLLQILLDSVDKPVVAAGGIASARGVAAVLAAGAEAAWIGTALLLCPEADVTEDARLRLQLATETDTILTTIFDRVNGLDWPEQFPGRTLKNNFTAKWHAREAELLSRPDEIRNFRAAAALRDYDVTSIFTGQAAGMLLRPRPAVEVLSELGDGAEALLRERLQNLFG